MSTPATTIFDLEALLAPVSAGRPAGESLRYDGTYDRIRDARREDDPRLSRGIYEAELKRANWAEVESLCTEALAARSKDLQIAAWLTEAWLRRYGFAGAREGMQLLAALCERFWDDLHPTPEGGDFGARVAPFEWINDKLSLLLKTLPVTAPQSSEVLPYTYADWESACELDQLSKRDAKAAQAAEARGQVTVVKFSASLMLTDAAFFAELYEVVSDAADASTWLERLLDEKCGTQAPSLHGFRESLFAVRRLAADVLQSRPEAEEYAAPVEGDEMQFAEDSEDEGGRLWPSAPIRSRDEAYRRLAEAADYLLRTEPHSPTPYLVLRAVEWGSMSLQEVLQQIVRNDGEMQEINRLLRLTAAGDPRQ